MEHERSTSNYTLQSTWNKVERDSIKIGMRDGLVDGRQKVYQRSFDVGYDGGFKNGFTLGQYKAISRVKELEGEPIEHHQSLNETRKGICAVCTNKNLLEESIEEISNIQAEKIIAFLNELNKK